MSRGPLRLPGLDAYTAGGTAPEGCAHLLPEDLPCTECTAMEITEIRIKLMAVSPPGNGRLRAFCSITLDSELVIRDLKVIEGTRGLFVAMPSRKLTERCPHGGCGAKNALLARYCASCGRRLQPIDLAAGDMRFKLHADIAHPITTACRVRMEAAILQRYRDVLANPALQDAFENGEDDHC